MLLSYGLGFVVVVVWFCFCSCSDVAAGSVWWSAAQEGLGLVLVNCSSPWWRLSSSFRWVEGGGFGADVVSV